MLTCVNAFHILFSPDTVLGYEELWFIGDNFMAETYRNHYKKVDDDWYTKQNFEVTPFCSSKHNDSNSNMISRILNTFGYAVNKKFQLPKFAVLVLDDDMIRYLDCNDAIPITSMLGEWVEYLTTQILEMCHVRIASILLKAIKIGYPLLYWVTTPHHKNFCDNYQCTQLNNALETVSKLFPDMRIIHMKEVWSYDDSTLVDSHGNLMSKGLTKYWLSVDAAIAFNAKKRDLYLAKQIIGPGTSGYQGKPKVDKLLHQKSEKTAGGNKKKMDTKVSRFSHDRLPSLFGKTSNFNRAASHRTLPTPP